MWLIELILALLGNAREAQRSTEAILKEIEHEGGMALPCGCFIACRASDMRLVVEQSNPQAFIRVVRTIGGDHDCPESTEGVL